MSEVNVIFSYIIVVIDCFVWKGLVERKCFNLDCRIVYLEIIEYGREVIEKFEVVCKEYYKERFKGWSD